MVSEARSNLLRRATLFVALFVLALGTVMFTDAGSTAAHAQTNRFAIVFAVGGLGDQSFNDSAYAGILRAADTYGIDFDYAEPGSVAEYETVLSRFAQSRRYDLIISIGFNQEDAVTTVASRFPAQRFAIIDAVAPGDNVASYVYNEAERGFLLGAIAGLMTQRDNDPNLRPGNTVGVIGGMDIPLINSAIAGYIAGARYVNPAADVRYSYVGDFVDPARGKELALAQFDQGVDVVWGAAGVSGLGVIQAAEESNRYVMGADDDQSHLAPQHVLTSGLKQVNNTVLFAVGSVIADEFVPGVHTLGIAEKALGYTESRVPADIRVTVETLAARVAAGELTPPETIDAVDAWLQAND